jgi:hypothetical protein
MKCAELESTKATLEALLCTHKKMTESLEKLDAKNRELESADSNQHSVLTRRISELERDNKSQQDESKWDKP